MLPADAGPEAVPVDSGCDGAMERGCDLAALAGGRPLGALRAPPAPDASCWNWLSKRSALPSAGTKCCSSRGHGGRNCRVVLMVVACPLITDCTVTGTATALGSELPDCEVWRVSRC